MNRHLAFPTTLLLLAACTSSQSTGDNKPAAAAVSTAETAANAPRIKGEEVSYESDGVTFKGYIAWDENKTGERPGVLVVHEWWGHNEYARKRARMLAELGYTALAVDMYGDGKQANHPNDAMKFAGEVVSNLASATARFNAAKALLGKHPTTDGSKTSAIGYCFGGGVVLHMARAGVDLDGVASFHGSLGTETPAEAGTVKAKLLVANGAADPFVTPEQIAAFEKEMADAGVDLTFINYPGAMHSFTNPDADELGKRFDLPLAYNAEADAKSWAELEKLLAGLYGG
jgi:dienelactone hydrolase